MHPAELPLHRGIETGVFGNVEVGDHTLSFMSFQLSALSNQPNSPKLTADG
jgi:hypothetical protein